mmetsp:Transcript_77195/g.153222  ORF Transcript_77195/g.153222 Transcript_77195/m.153222 type:complete len:242 (-) Transcript_77195:184-909(-)
MQRSASITIHTLHLGPRLEKDSSTLDCIHRHRPVHRRVRRPVLCVHVRTSRHKCRDTWQRILANGPVQRRALLAISRVDELWGSALQQSLQEGERVGTLLLTLASKLHCDVQHRAFRVVDGIHSRARIEKGQRRGSVTLGDGKPERRLHRIVGLVNLSAFGQRLDQHLLAAVEGKPVHRGHVTLVDDRQWRTSVEERLSSLKGSRLAGEEQRRAQLPVLRAQFGSIFEQRGHARCVVELSG